MSRTYAQDDDEDEEGVGHGEDGGGDRRDHLAQLLDAAEEPDDPQGPHQPHQPGRDGGKHHVQYGHGHDEDVQPVLRRQRRRGGRVFVHIRYIFLYAIHFSSFP